MSLNNFSFIVSFSLLLIAMVILQLIRKALSSEKIIPFIQLLLIFSYGCFFIYKADTNFGICILINIICAYIFGIAIEKAKKQNSKKLLLSVGISIILAILGYFKYSNFFIESISKLFKITYISTLNIILPIGISFYSFTVIGYLIDVYGNKITPEKNILNLSLFISYFPKITAGPITRANDFLPQIKNYRGVELKAFEEGIQIFVLGLFKKMVLSDHLSIFVNDIFEAPSEFSTFTIWLGVLSYSLQIFLDFSGYSDMAIGISKIIGIELPRNFNLPYIAENISDFWKRWHISLSKWFQDYLYIPLGGNRKGSLRTYFNLFFVMFVSGIWHGAGYTFIIWGILHGIKSCLNRLLKNKKFKQLPKINYKVFRIIETFFSVTLFWIAFRAENISNMLAVCKSMFTLHQGINQYYTWTFFAITYVFAMTGYSYKKSKQNACSSVDFCYPILNLEKVLPLAFFIVFCAITVLLGYYGNTAFIYGKF